MSAIEVSVPDIGDFTDIPVIEVLVKPGDAVAVDDSLITLESDKATMDVPSPSAGTVKELRVNAGDKVSKGTVVLTLETPTRTTPAESPSANGERRGDANADTRSRAPSVPGTTSAPPVATPSPPSPRGEKGRADTPGEGANSTPPAGPTIEVLVPDIGEFSGVPVIEVFVKPGDIVKRDDPLVTLESDKATMEVPSPLDGIVEGVRVSVGETVSEGTPLLALRTAQTATESASGATPTTHPASVDVATPPDAPASRATGPAVTGEVAPPSSLAHASPAVRKFARELGADVARVTGSGPKGRVVKEDVQAYIKRSLAADVAASQRGGGGGQLDLLAWPTPDFAKFGPIETTPLSRIRKIAGANLSRNWVLIPHVTQFDAADITDLEPFRVALNAENEKAGVKVTMLAFLIKASVAALRKFPDFNASLDASGENLIRKRYFNVGFAADTPAGLVVPVLKGADQKGVVQIAKEMGELSAKARDGKLGPADMQGGCFSISSLGGIGGTAFTPIVNAPEVAILGVSRSAQKPLWTGTTFMPRLMLPLSLSYDHRVIDGAQAARFTTYFASVLADFRRALL